MTKNEFFYWLQGSFGRIRRLVAAHFEHVIDPLAGDKAKQDALNNIHPGDSGVTHRC